jgi:hypothetical protein
VYKMDTRVYTGSGKNVPTSNVLCYYSCCLALECS